MTGPNPEGTRRHRAIAEVLCRVPTEWYEGLKEQVETFIWFIPHLESRGEVHPFPVTIYPETKEGDLRLRPYSKVLYLSPMLERAALDIGVAVIAHELAHIALKHNVFPGNGGRNSGKGSVGSYRRVGI